MQTHCIDSKLHTCPVSKVISHFYNAGLESQSTSKSRHSSALYLDDYKGVELV